MRSNMRCGAAALVTVALAIAASCTAKAQGQPIKPQANSGEVISKPHTPTGLPPNEVGRIPVLMYHAVGGPAIHGIKYDRLGLNIAPATFRKHLAMMRAAHWYPINLRDALSARIDVPAGFIPVVITFDDARGSQFRYLPNGMVDPNCAVGILCEFHTEHTDWPLRATFFVLPASQYNPPPFGQSRYVERKLQFLVANGFELANHSTTHRFLSRLSGSQLEWEMAQCVRYVDKYAPDATMDTMALPYGDRPRTEALINVLLDGSQGGTHYHNRCIADAWGGPTYAPASRKFNRRAVLRIGTGPNEVERWIHQLKPGRSMGPYVSDGDPDAVTVPKAALAEVDAHRLAGCKLRFYAGR